jgi:hypothetical protein
MGGRAEGLSACKSRYHDGGKALQAPTRPRTRRCMKAARHWRLAFAHREMHRTLTSAVTLAAKAPPIPGWRGAADWASACNGVRPTVRGAIDLVPRGDSSSCLDLNLPSLCSAPNSRVCFHATTIVFPLGSRRLDRRRTNA